MMPLHHAPSKPSAALGRGQHLLVAIRNIPLVGVNLKGVKNETNSDRERGEMLTLAAGPHNPLGVTECCFSFSASRYTWTHSQPVQDLVEQQQISF